ncbi:DUF547 domain-containing protein [bacterium]|nr:DUF547 domain-containing protein [bacterium]
MLKKTFLSFLLVLVILLQNSFAFEHSKFHTILQKYVKNGFVSYKALLETKTDLAIFRSYLTELEKTETAKLNQNEKLAFWINVYNAYTIELILQNYPVKSIKKIGTLLKGPWDQEIVKVGGKKFTLNHVEHEILRKEFKEPRIHFAIVCASISCPNLLPKAFNSENTQILLDEAGKNFINDEAKNKYDKAKNTLYASAIFDWFSEDFKNSGGVVGVWNNYSKTKLEKPEIKFLDYDWNLNEN